MPSVFTIAGASERKPRKRKSKAKKSKSRKTLGSAQLGDCKPVKGRPHIELCYVGQTKKYPSGWAFKRK